MPGIATTCEWLTLALSKWASERPGLGTSFSRVPETSPWMVYCVMQVNVYVLCDDASPSHMCQREYTHRRRHKLHTSGRCGGGGEPLFVFFAREENESSGSLILM